jgi:hypothetical protein
VGRFTESMKDSTHNGPLQKVAEVRIGMVFVNVVAIAFAVPVIAGFMFLVMGPLGAEAPELDELVGFAGGAFVLVVIHELLHGAAAMLFAGLKWKTLKFGVNWKALAPYCNCVEPVPLGKFRMVALFPLAVTAPVCFVLMLWHPSFATAGLAATAMLGAIGDVIMCLRILGYDSKLLIVEDPSGIGGDIFSRETISGDEEAVATP